MAGGSEEPEVGMTDKEGCVYPKVEMECICCGVYMLTTTGSTKRVVLVLWLASEPVVLIA